MLGRFRNAIASALSGLDDEDSFLSSSSSKFEETLRLKFPYGRPEHLSLVTEDEIQVSADHSVRPILVPRDVKALPWYSGYGEAINAGKSFQNEDQATVYRGVVNSSQNGDLIPYVYFGLFDGHAGSGVAVAASKELHLLLADKLNSVSLILNYSNSSEPDFFYKVHKDISVNSLIIGALESAFWEMDLKIGSDKKRFKMLGGCTVLVSLFILGKLFVANAGDSRSIVVRNKVPQAMSFDFTPISERQRLQQLGFSKPHLLGSEYTHLDYSRRPMRKDLGKKMLIRDAHMTGWTYKEISHDDLKFPLVYGEGKRSRLLATIGVTRGFGDHDLIAQSQNERIFIKPFLSSQPEVRVLEIETENIGASDVLIMGTDGLWDVVSNQKVAEIVDRGLETRYSLSGDREKYRFISIAQDLVMSARGKLQDRSWKQSDGSAATIDDIAVFVIPLLGYKDEWINGHKSDNEINSFLETDFNEFPDKEEEEE